LNRIFEIVALQRLSDWPRPSRPVSSCRNLATGCVIWCLATLLCSAEESLATRTLIQIQLKTNAQCQNNVVRLSDIATISGNLPASMGSVESIAVGPAPSIDSNHSWTREDVLQILQLHGISANQIQWIGPQSCVLHRVTQVRAESNSEVKSNSVVKRASYVGVNDFSPANLTPQIIANSQRNTAQVITNYLQSESEESLQYKVDFTLPKQIMKTLSSRANIIGVSGGEAPWTGKQQFEVLYRSKNEEVTALIDAFVTLPPSVWAAVGPLPKGRVVSAEDLKEVVLPPSGKISLEDCFVDSSQVIGQELRRSVSTDQPLQRRDLGPARIILQNQTIEIQVVAGSIVAKTGGKALQSGGQDEVIQVEVFGNKKQLVARVIGPGQVEAIAAAIALP